jgi:large subunit ribosomal protein L10
MSKLVKGLITKELQKKLQGVSDALVADVIGLDSEKTATLRAALHAKKIKVLVVKNSLARRATEGTALAPAFEGLAGSSAVVWGAEDFISLVKEVHELDKSKKFEQFVPKGGVFDGEAFKSDRIAEMSKWPNRAEQLSILAGTILGPGANLAAAIKGPGGTLAGQIKSKSEEETAA